MLKSYIETDDILGAYFTAMGTMAALVVPAVLLVVWQPASAGSGIPEIISYLNGVKPARNKVSLSYTSCNITTLLSVFEISR